MPNRSARNPSPRPARPAAVRSGHSGGAGGPRARLRALQSIASLLSAEPDPDAVVRHVLLAALQLLDADGGSLLLHDPGRDCLRFTAVEGEGKETLEGQCMPAAAGIAGWAFTRGETLAVDDVSRDPRFFAVFDEATGYRTRSLIAAPLVAAGNKIGVLELVSKRRGAFAEDDAGLLTVLASLSAVAIENAHLYRHLWEERNRSLDVEEEVRRELARDIHDGPAQSLSAIVMNARFAKTLLAEGAPAEVEQELSSLEDIATRALVQVRGLLFNQRPIVLDTRGLFPALEMTVQHLRDANQLDVCLDVRCPPVRLPGRGDRTVFSIVQESLGNARKHAPGAHVRIGVDRAGDQLIIKVADDGPGFDMAAVRSTYDKRGSLGLLNMSERAQQLGGSVEIDSAPGAGTRVTLSVPIAQPAAAAAS